MKQGKLFVFSGPSATGKGTICRELLKDPDTWLSVSLTTRAPREGEEHGVHYYFVTREEYDRTVEEDGFLEHAEIYGNCYGTPKRYALEHMAAGEDVILEIEMQGALQIKKAYPEAVLIFVLPPSLKELQNRIRKRGSESEEQIAARMKTTLSEIELLPEYDYFLVNDDLDEAIATARSIMKAEHCKTAGTAQALIDKYKEER
ncbi:MAG: guanylate kinase [Firmicutes bacterium]|jgi:guanylate kinase|nr:guanylate kinase [Bacillota bacterium]MBQ3661962.1 guanylate kinase [Bacillota bacterium]MBR0209271.1 guanylate kinase [Bacillota bacterium]MBR0517448.1 guanylate kinase [Bacillota bacterium]MBR2099541.1 guanylate kinase [Bacillota bacterium]